MPEAGGEVPFSRPPWWGRRRVVVQDHSMEPGLLPGDRLYVDTRAYRRKGPARGDIVVVRDPDDPRRWLLKRVAGLPGDRLPGTLAPVPTGCLFLLGDRSADSRDSRAFGPVPYHRLVGRATFRYAPAPRRGPLDQGILK
jgi:inner membrane protease subunit 1